MNHNRFRKQSLARGRGAALALSVLLALTPGVPARLSAQTPPAPSTSAPGAGEIALAALVDHTPVPGAQIGVVVIEANSGRTVFARGAELSLNPASNAKLLTAAVALARLGPSHRFTTDVRAIAPVNGQAPWLVLRSDGDPSLTASDLFAFARGLYAQGLRRVTGDVWVDDRALGSEHLPPAFEQQPQESAAFRAAVSAVSIDENALSIRVGGGAAPGLAAHIEVEPPGYTEIDNQVVTSVRGPAAVRIDASPLRDGRERLRLTGTVPNSDAPAVFRRRLSNPSVAAGSALRAALITSGVRVDGGCRVGEPPSGGRTLLVRQSAPLSALLYQVGKASNNFYAEMLLLAIGAHVAPQAPSFASGSRDELAWLNEAGIDTTGISLRNGSGLFDANRISARQIAGVLRTVWREPAFRDEYIAQLAIGGEDGTLSRRLGIAGARGWVRAKTGTLDDVIALSGFVLHPDPSQTLVFSVLANGVRGHQPEARALADRIVSALALRAQQRLPIR